MKNRRCSVLIAEADRIISQGFRLHLERAGFTVFVAYDGQQAEILAARQRFDFMIVDFALPETGGAEFCRHVREDLRLIEVSIVVCSTTGSESDTEALVFRYGISQVFYKPINPAIVVEFARETVEFLVTAN